MWFSKIEWCTWWGEVSLFSYVSWLPSVEKRKLFLLILSSDSDLGNLSISPLSSASDISFCLLFFLLFLLSLALFELNFDASEELSRSSPNPPTPLKSLDATDAAATAAVVCQVTKQSILSRPKKNNFIVFYQLVFTITVIIMLFIHSWMCKYT